MKFFVDAQLPYGLKLFLFELGYDTLHTDDLPNKEKTQDDEIRLISVSQNRIVITKDSDFLDSYYINKIPQKLLLISTGNIKNKYLFNLFKQNMSTLTELF